MELKRVKGIAHWLKIRSLYLQAFPKYERKPLLLIMLKYLQGRSDVWVMEESGEFSGFSATLNAKDMVLIDYFAVSAEKRGRNLGSKALQQLQNCYSGRRMFLEIESVYEHSENLEERRRRKQFYLKNGMTPMRKMINVFGTPMELLGYNCIVEFDEYREVYRSNFGEKLADRLAELPYPETVESSGL